MLKNFNKRIKNEKGLTLIELLAVIVILAIIAAIAVPSITGIIKTTEDKAIFADAANILAAAKVADTSGACASTTYTCDAADLSDFIDGIGAGLDYGATKESSGAWTVTYEGFKNLKTDKFKGFVTSNTISETALNNAINP